MNPSHNYVVSALISQMSFKRRQGLTSLPSTVSLVGRTGQAAINNRLDQPYERATSREMISRIFILVQ
jgi:hypothetical protein